MRLRTIALALVLACGFTALGEARNKPSAMRVKPNNRRPANQRIKPRKAQKHKVVNRRVKR